jgi:phosphodiesterase/alkaline phosphatase D-like protein
MAQFRGLSDEAYCASFPLFQSASESNAIVSYSFAFGRMLDLFSAEFKSYRQRIGNRRA